MTFIAGASYDPAEPANPLADDVEINRKNIQLFFMNQLSLHNLSVQNIVNGFVDTFQDQEGVDETLSIGHYDLTGKYYCDVAGRIGLTQLIEINETSNIEQSDVNGLSVNDEGLRVNKTIISDGESNQETDYATSAMTSSSAPEPASVSASSQYSSPDCPAWRVFDQNEAHSTDPQQCWISSSTASEVNPQWLKIDLGAGVGKVINKYRLMSRNSSDPTYVAAPKNFRLLGSNDDISWITLDSRQDFVQLPSNTWSAYLTFENAVVYRYYKLEITASWGAGLTSLSQLKLVEASYDVPTTLEVVCISGIFTSEWSTITDILPSFSTPGSTKIFYALSFNKGADSENWKIRDGSDWKSVARLNSDNWQYLDETGIWIDSDLNTRCSTLKQALEIDANQMDSQVLAAINEAWSGVSVAGELAIAVGMLADANQDVPFLESLTITYDIDGRDLDLISLAYEASSTINRADGSILLKNMNDNVKLFVNLGDGPPEWIELSGLTRTANFTSQVEHYSASIIDINALSGPIRIRVTAPAGLGTEIHGWSLNWGS